MTSITKAWIVTSGEILLGVPYKNDCCRRLGLEKPGQADGNTGVDNEGLNTTASALSAAVLV
jgi:hypothetical protein